MELHMWGGEWGLPSVDPESLQAYAAVRFSGAPAKIVECSNPWTSPEGLIPYFKCEDGHVLYSAHEIAVYLRSKNFSGDYGLTATQCAETTAYNQLIFDALEVAYRYCYWVHEGNYSATIRPIYGRRLPWVYKLWYPDRQRNQASALIASMYQNAETLGDALEPCILKKAKMCIQLLSEKLGSHEFFLGTTTPTTLDGVVFSYLAIFWKAQMQLNPLKDAILERPNLERYLIRIQQRYFPPGRGSSNSNADSVTQSNSSASSTPAIFSGPNVIFGLLVAGSMLSYAIFHRMVHVPRIR